MLHDGLPHGQILLFNLQNTAPQERNSDDFGLRGPAIYISNRVFAKTCISIVHASDGAVVV